ncbi:hypothetical protein [Mucilaginibacter ginkgonis]|uniref:Uncharacterized protein n=1 Tax=Mucilaginibacter ginkgonis TaxID=2682091 RepID=A0A6I4IPD1_9SPHI|nr:hypothetical protein [Mucilaginibacter ginkgonis]QQL50842.1 hypothetical protein GO620_005120 [Mucilaginibacter ginkgonis]
MGFTSKLKKLVPALKAKDTIDEMTVCDVLLLCNDADRGDLKFGLPYSKLLDSVQEDLTARGYNCKQFAPPLSTIVGDLAWAKPYSATRLFLSVYLSGKLKNLFNKISNKSTLPAGYAERYIYKKVLEMTRPQMVIVIGAPAALCQEARKLSIPVMELLHGIGYVGIKWNWDKEPVGNLPTHILSLDPVSSESFSPLKEKGIQIIEIPHPWYIRFNEDAESQENIDPKWLEKPTSIPKDKKIILLSLTWGYDGDHGPYDHFANILPNGLIYDEVLQVIRETRDDVFWCIRRHPVQSRNKKYDYQIPFLNQLVAECPNCEWEESTNSTLHSILPVCDGNIAMFSMTVYEAAAVGVKSLMLCPTAMEGNINGDFFPDLEKSGYLIKAEPNVEVIRKWVANVKKGKPFSFTNSTAESWNSLLMEMKPKRLTER